MTYRIGLDVGGTNTDAVLLDARLNILAAVKTPTTEVSLDGVVTAVERVLALAGVDPATVSTLTLGTTHCTNAIVQRRDLSRVGVIRLGAPATTSVPPFSGWPDDLVAAINAGAEIVRGGHEFHGGEIAELDEAAIRSACERMRDRAEAVAVTGVFSPVSHAHEQRAAELVAETLEVPVCLSHEIGSVGLLERENATILNAALIHTLRDMVSGLADRLAERGVRARLFLGQNDGTLMRLDYALRFPVYTIGSGPTNSLRGAAQLTGKRDALVVDIGGTTSDIGVLVDGFPRQSAHATTIGGIRTNFRMPDVLSVGLGGGTVVHSGRESVVHSGGEIAVHSDAETAVHSASGRERFKEVRLGPESVGYRLTSEALAFGGNTLTATDLALAAGRLTIPGATAPHLPRALRAAAEAQLRGILEDSIDRMKPSAAPVPVILVGGGAAICPPDLTGVAEVIVPEHAGAANALGAALGDAAGQAEQVFSLSETSREAALEAVAEAARERAIAAGAVPETVELLHIEDAPMPYLEGAIFVRARAAGRLA